jgi:hypothetical protein
MMLRDPLERKGTLRGRCSKERGRGGDGTVTATEQKRYLQCRVCDRVKAYVLENLN